MSSDFELARAKGIKVGWSGLSPQERAILLFRKINETILERERQSSLGAAHARHAGDVFRPTKRNL